MSTSVNKDFVIKLEGKDFIRFRGLLDLAHQKGVVRVEVDIVQLPAKSNNDYAVCKATVTAKDGGVYSDVGDACTSNCNRLVARHLLRMASTRAVARALRTMTNTGITCLEELGGENEEEDKPKEEGKYKKKVKEEPKGKVEKGSVTGPAAGVRFKKALVSFNVGYKIRESHLLNFIGKSNASDLTEDDITSINYLWLNLESGETKAEEIIKKYV